MGYLFCPWKPPLFHSCIPYVCVCVCVLCPLSTLCSLIVSLVSLLVSLHELGSQLVAFLRFFSMISNCAIIARPLPPRHPSFLSRHDPNPILLCQPHFIVSTNVSSCLSCTSLSFHSRCLGYPGSFSSFTTFISMLLLPRFSFLCCICSCHYPLSPHFFLYGLCHVLYAYYLHITHAAGYNVLKRFNEIHTTNSSFHMFSHR